MGRPAARPVAWPASMHLLHSLRLAGTRASCYPRPHPTPTTGAWTGTWREGPGVERGVEAHAPPRPPPPNCICYVCVHVTACPCCCVCGTACVVLRACRCVPRACVALRAWRCVRGAAGVCMCGIACVHAGVPFIFYPRPLNAQASKCAKFFGPETAAAADSHPPLSSQSSINGNRRVLEQGQRAGGEAGGEAGEDK